MQIINQLSHYVRLRKSNLSRHSCYEMSGLDQYYDKAMTVLKWIVFTCSVLYLMSAQSNATELASTTRVQSQLTSQEAEIIALRKIVASCLSDATGKHIAIGNSHYLCGITHLGDF